MANKLKPFDGADGQLLGYVAKCPGCGLRHSAYVRQDEPGRPTWSFNGDLERPTFSPSLLCTYDWWTDGVKEARKCHSFIRDGEWQFLGDCTHSLAGQTVPMTDYETDNQRSTP